MSAPRKPVKQILGAALLPSTSRELNSRSPACCSGFAAVCRLAERASATFSHRGRVLPLDAAGCSQQPCSFRSKPQPCVSDPSCCARSWLVCFCFPSFARNRPRCRIKTSLLLSAFSFRASPAFRDWKTPPVLVRREEAFVSRRGFGHDETTPSAVIPLFSEDYGCPRSGGRISESKQALACGFPSGYWMDLQNSLKQNPELVTFLC